MRETTRRKLVIWDVNWSPHAGEFSRLLGEAWEVRAGQGDIDWLRRELREAAALVAVSLPSIALPEARGLGVFLYPGAGLVDAEAGHYPLGCPVVNVYEHETPIAEYALMMMLAHVTGLRQHTEALRQGCWEGSGRIGGRPHEELAGQTLGLLGYGRIGRAIAARARAFGMRAVAVRRSEGTCVDELDLLGGPERLRDLLRQANFLVIAAPLNRETEGLIGEAELALLPAGALLINVSRAEIVEERALYEALVSGRLGGAALDVWYQYPQPGERGFGSKLPFHELPSVQCTPHYSAWTQGLIRRRIAGMCENLARWRRGEDLERVVLTGRWRP
ncbi:MAG: NAD(P)-dependent oxidoreductase [Acidobacteriota bacterium]